MDPLAHYQMTDIDIFGRGEVSCGCLSAMEIAADKAARGVFHSSVCKRSVRSPLCKRESGLVFLIQDPKHSLIAVNNKQAVF